MKSILSIFVFVNFLAISSQAGIGVGPSTTLLKCSNTKSYTTGDPDFVQDKEIEIHAMMTCSNPLPGANTDFETAKEIVNGLGCDSIVQSDSTHESFVIGFERIIAEHSIMAHLPGDPEIIPHKKCVKNVCGIKGMGCSCAASVEAPELGFTIKVNGLTVATNKTANLSERKYEVKQVTFTDVKIFAGEESVTVDGVVKYSGKPQREMYSTINHEIGPETRNLSYDMRNLNFKDLDLCKVSL